VNKILWDDYELNPSELIAAIWSQIPDWKEGIEVTDGMFRKFIPNYEEPVVRELLVNALVHRPYTMRGDVFINLYPDRLEIVNPGLFPLGVTPTNLLHKNVRRNRHLANVFHDLHLMEGEGSGIDMLYRVLLGNAKALPIPFQGDDFVKFTVHNRVSKSEIVSLIDRANEMYQLNARELIVLGIIAQNSTITALRLHETLQLKDVGEVSHWFGRLLELGLVLTKGKTKGTEYLVNGDFLKLTNFKGKTTLKRIEPHRLEELIYQDVKIYGPTTIIEIQLRIGEELSLHKIRRSINDLVAKNELQGEGGKRNRKYSLV
jgi:ATP-dependent DNA helicase RecG